MSGYVRIHRKLLGHAVFRSDAEAMAFAWLVIRAAWKPCKVRYKERLIHLERGQLAVSQRDMARAMERDKAWIERFWKRLKTEAMIEANSEAGVAVITICNYNEYQADREIGEAVSEAQARQGRGTEQEREEKEEKKKTSTPHAFAGRVIKLNAADFSKWQDTYHGIRDLRAELTSIDAWLVGVPEQQGKWFHSVQRMLNKKHQEALKPAVDARSYLQEPMRV